MHVFLESHRVKFESSNTFFSFDGNSPFNNEALIEISSQFRYAGWLSIGFGKNVRAKVVFPTCLGPPIKTILVLRSFATGILIYLCLNFVIV